MKQVLLVTALAGLLLAGCGPGGGAVAVAPSETVQSTAARVEATSPAAAGAQISPLPTPAVPGATITLLAETPIVSPAEAESRKPDGLTKAKGEAVIIYRRSGGFAGVSQQWTIYPDGRITASDGREWQVTPERVEQLLGAIEDLGFFEMNGRYMPLNPCCDRFTYQITVRSGDRVNTVTTMDAAPDTPSALWDILGALDRVLSGASDE